MKKLFVFFLLFSLSVVVHAQQTYWVFFTDKKECTFDPQKYFAPEAIERRIIHNLPLHDLTDYPVNENYLTQVKNTVTETGFPSRWFNAVEVIVTPEELVKINAMPFVASVKPSASYSWFPTSLEKSLTGDTLPAVKGVETQVKNLQGDLFFKKGITGKGVIVAILDVGFLGYKENNMFEQLRMKNQIRLTYDFVARDENVDSGDSHGAEVLSCMAGITDSLNMGMATGSDYLLARIAKPLGNQQLAESRWIAAMEWADKNGARIINNSGGPNDKTYFPEQMDGKTCLISRAGNMAARKGMLVISAAGNEGQDAEPLILPPSDADSVLGVGAAEKIRGNCLRSAYSSYGPTADLRAKPDVCAPGTVLAFGSNGDSREDEGTSFSSPLVAGFAACVLELEKNKTAMELFADLKRSGSLYPYFDYYHGTGFPQASYFLDKKPVAVTNRFTLSSDPFSVWVTFPFDTDDACEAGKLLYYAIEDNTGRLLEYNMVDVRLKKITVADRRAYNSDFKVKLFYDGQYAEMVL